MRLGGEPMLWDMLSDILSLTWCIGQCDLLSKTNPWKLKNPKLPQISWKNPNNPPQKPTKSSQDSRCGHAVQWAPFEDLACECQSPVTHLLYFFLTSVCFVAVHFLPVSRWCFKREILRGARLSAGSWCCCWPQWWSERVQKHERGIEGPFPFDLAVPQMFPYRWEQVSSVLSPGGAGACVPGLWMAPGWCFQWKGGCSIFEALQQGIQALLSGAQVWPCLEAEKDSLKHGYCVTLAGRIAGKYV